MKKLVFLIALFFSFYSYGQYKYKVEYEITVNPATFGSFFTLWADTTSDSFLQLGYGSAPGAASGGGPITFVGNKIVEFSQEIILLRYQLHDNIAFNLPPNITNSNIVYNNCYEYSVTPFNPPGATFTYLRVYRLNSFLEINNYSTINNQLLKCEVKTINTIPSNCTELISYALEYSIGNDDWKELLIYGANPSFTEIEISDFLGLEVGEILKLRIRYTNKPTIPIDDNEYSDMLIYNYVDCSPQLVQDPPEVVAPKCSNSDDGSIIVKFGRPLASNERMLIYVERLLSANPDTWGAVVPSDILNASDINTANNNTYTWPKVLEPGTYRLRYVSKYDSTGNIIPNPNSDELSSNFIIKAPDPVIFTHSNTNILCKGTNIGTITFETTSGGSNTGYQYSIDDGLTWQNSATFIGLAPNVAPATYNLRARDSNGCVSEITSSVAITEPPLALTVDYDILKNPSAAGVSDGEISINSNGGTGSLTYQWQKNGANYSTNQNITNLGAGVYKVTVTDANGCTASTNEQTLVEPPSLGVLFSVETIDCNGDKATITAQGQGGFIANGEDYTYLWSNGATTKTINVVAGTYSVTVKDSNDATAEDTVTLNEPEAFTILENSTPVLCNGANNGTIDLVISGGTGAYTIAWQDDTNITSANRIDLANGEYFYTITDEKGCFTNGSIFISEPLAIDIVEGTTVNPTTVGGTDGSIEVNVSEGTPPYTYQWTNSNGDPIGTNSNSISGLGDDTYTVTVRDANYALSAVNAGCQSSLDIRLAEPQPLSVTIIEDPISCFGDNDGQLTAEPIGGAVDYTYEWFKENNGNFESLNLTTKTISDLLIGNYRVIVTDNVNAQAQTDYELKQPIKISIIVATENIKCFDGNDGTIEITSEGGTAPYTYSWSDGSGIPFSTDKDVSNLHSGNYTVIISDSKGCFVEQTIELTAPNEQLSITLDQLKEPSSATATDGFINVNITGGTLDYTFKWTDDTGTEIATTKNLSNIGEGVYTLTVRDGNAGLTTDNSGCIATDNFALLAPDAIKITIKETTSILCKDMNIGELTAIVSGGFLNFGSDYKYTWNVDNNGTFESINQTEIIATDLVAGTYQIVVTDDNNIEQTATYQLLEPIAIVIDLTIGSTVSCGNGADGSINASVEGGTAPYTYSWSNGETTLTISNLGVGTYTLTVTDKNNCEFSNSIELTQPGGMTVKSTETSPACFGGNEGAISLTITGGTSPYTYSWNTGATTSDITNLIAGNYDVTITDNAGCKSILSFILENPEQLSINLGDDKELCKGQLYEIDATIEDVAANYQWTSTNGFTSLEPIVAITEAGDYTLTITNSNGCIATDSMTLTTTDEIISADFLVPTQAFVGETIVVVDVSNPVPDTIAWEFSQGTTIVSQNGDYAELKFDKEGVYTVSLTTTKGSCQETLTKEIIVQPNTNFGTEQDTDTSFIKEFKLYPNPNTGVFKIEVELQQIAAISIKIINLTSNAINNTKIGEGKKHYVLDYNINTAIGVYLVLLETPKGSQIRKIIVK